MRFYWLILGTLAVWRVSHLIVAEAGPWHLLDRLRSRARGNLGELINCIYCVSVWIAAPVAILIGESWKERLLLWPALSGAAILLDALSNRSGADDEAETPPALYFEDKFQAEFDEGEKDHVLRQEQDKFRMGRR